jgi:micrococcal nuclease
MSHFLTLRLSVLLTVLLSGCAPPQSSAQQQDNCIVARVSDGDSFHCQDGRRVRLIGIDSPQSQQRPFGQQARQALVKLLPPDSVVRLESDIKRADQYGRVLAYVWVGPILANEAMLRAGWAVLYTVPPNVKYVERLQRAQKEARAGNAGLWASHGFDCSPKDYRRRACISPP